MPIYLEIALVLGLILANGLFATSEIAIVTARRGRLRHMAEQGKPGAAAAQELAHEPTDFLSTIQVGITLVGILIGLVGGASFSGPLAGLLAGVPALAPYAQTLAYVLVVTVTTYLTLIFGELVPKRLALGNPEGLAARIARPMRLLSRAAAPVVALLSASTEGVLRLLGRNREEASPATEADIRALVAEAARHGTMHRSEGEIVDEVLHLGDRRLADIMTPRDAIEWVDLRADGDALRERLRSANHTRFLACDGALDRIVGVVHARAALQQCLQDKLDLRGLAVEPLTASGDMRLLRAVELLQTDRAELIVVQDADRVRGLVTMDDIVANLLTDLPAHEVNDGDDLQRRDDGSVLADGQVSLDRIVDLIDAEGPALEAAQRDQRVADFLRAGLDHAPRVGDVVERWGLRFEIVDLDGRRIDRVLVGRRETEGHSENV